MDVASLELSKKIYDLTGWEETKYRYSKYDGEFILEQCYAPGGKRGSIPAYDLGFMLRKLQRAVTSRHKIRLGITQRNFYITHKGKTHPHFASTPEDAAAKLVIELINNGALGIEDV